MACSSVVIRSSSESAAQEKGPVNSLGGAGNGLELVMLPQQHSLNCSDGEHCGYVACLLVESVKEKAFVGKREGIFSIEQLLRLRWSRRWVAHAMPAWPHHAGPHRLHPLLHPVHVVNHCFPHVRIVAPAR